MQQETTNVAEVKTDESVSGAEAFRKIHPLEFLKKFLREGARPDGRSLSQARTTIFNTGSLNTSRGSSLVRIGNTSVICGIKAEVAIPHEQEPNKGFCFCNVQIPKVGDGSLTYQRRDEMAMFLTSSINKILNQCIERKQLCILEGKSSWVLYVDVYVLENDGTLFDACLLSCIIALKDLKLYKVVHDEEKEEVTVFTDEKLNRPVEQSLPNLLSFLPIPSTFGSLPTFDALDIANINVNDQNEQSVYILADPTHEEEELLSTIITFVYNSETKELCQYFVTPKTATSAWNAKSYQTSSYFCVPFDIMRQCMEAAKKRVDATTNQINRIKYKL